MDPYESEKEQIEKLRRWWRENGRALLLGVALGLGALFGWRAWQEWRLERAAAASELYEQVLDRRAAGDADGVAVLVERLAREHGGSAYEAMARLQLAALLAREGRLEQAEGHLRRAREAAPDPAFEAAARLRLARVLLARGEREAARALLAEDVPAAFEPLRAELEGDLAAAGGDAAQAREAYERAMKALAGDPPLARLIELKRDDQGVPPSGGAGTQEAGKGGEEAKEGGR